MNLQQSHLHRNVIIASNDPYLRANNNGPRLHFVTAQCPEGWLPTMDKCYWFSAPKDVSAANWTHAKDLCKSQDPLATLTTTVNQEEREFVASKSFIASTCTLSRKHVPKFFSAHIYGKSFIGATDVNTEGEWIWDQTGDVVQVNFWADGEPNGGDKENCMTIDHEGNWADVPCTVANGKELDFVCSVPNGTNLKIRASKQFTNDSFCNVIFRYVSRRMDLF